MKTLKRLFAAGGDLVDDERGDVPGWVLVTLMTAALVVVIWAVAGPALVDLFEQASVDGTPVREILGDDPVAFAEDYVLAYNGRNWVDKERTRLTETILAPRRSVVAVLGPKASLKAAPAFEKALFG